MDEFHGVTGSLMVSCHLVDIRNQKVPHYNNESDMGWNKRRMGGRNRIAWLKIVIVAVAAMRVQVYMKGQKVPPQLTHFRGDSRQNGCQDGQRFKGTA